MSDKGSKIVMEIIKSLESRISKIEKELKYQQEVVKKLVICISELTNVVKNLPDKEIRKKMAFKYPFISTDMKLNLSLIDIEEASTKLLMSGQNLDQMSELSYTENEEFSISSDTIEILDNL